MMRKDIGRRWPLTNQWERTGTGPSQTSDGTNPASTSISGFRTGSHLISVVQATQYVVLWQPLQNNTRVNAQALIIVWLGRRKSWYGTVGHRETLRTLLGCWLGWAVRSCYCQFVAGYKCRPDWEEQARLWDLLQVYHQLIALCSAGRHSEVE